MRCRHAVFAGWIAGVAFLRHDLALTGNAALQLRSNLLPRPLLKWISAAEGKPGEYNREEKRPGPHPLILETKQEIANR